MTQGDGNLGVKGKNFEMLFSIAGAGPASLKVNGTEWLWRAPRPAFWRASTDNDRGCGFPLRAAAWMAADVFVTYNGMKVLEAGPDCVKVQFQFGIPTVPGASAELVYTVEAQGALRVDAVYHGVAGAPELPCFGVKFETFGPVTRTVWTGLSGETYPDRYKGGVFGCHEETPHVEPHLVPQDCGMHMQTRQAMLEQRDACRPHDCRADLAAGGCTICVQRAAQHGAGDRGGAAHYGAARDRPHQCDGAGRSARRWRH